MRRLVYTILKSAAGLAAALSLLHCSHPYEEGMTGSFPALELVSSQSISMPARGTESEMTSVIELKTNLRVKTEVVYMNSDSDGWINDIKTEYDLGAKTAKITFTVSKNTITRNRYASIVISSSDYPDDMEVKVSQDPYVFTGGEEVYEGDLVLRTQEDVEAFIYTSVTGRLIIGNRTSSSQDFWQQSFTEPSIRFLESDICDISRLKTLKKAEGIIIVGNTGLSDLSPLEGAETPFVELTAMLSSAVYSYNGKAEAYYLTSSLESFADLDFLQFVRGAEEMVLRNNDIWDISRLGNLSSVETLDIACNSGIRDIAVLADMAGLRTADVSGLDIARTQVNYIKAIKPSLSIVYENLQRSGDLSVSVPSSTLTSSEAEVKATISRIYNTSESGCILTSGDTKFNFDYRTPFTSSVPEDSPFTFRINSLNQLTEYVLYLYVIDNYGFIHLSPACRFMTPARITYRYTLNASFPSYLNDADEAADKKQINALILKRLDDLSVATESYGLEKSSGDTWFFECGSGVKDMMLHNISKSSTVEIAFSEIDNNGDNTDRRACWIIRQDGNKGLGQDILAVTDYSELTADATRNLTFQRLSAKISSLSVSLTGNYPTDKISEISVSIDNLYNEVRMSTAMAGPAFSGTSSISYSVKAESGTSHTLASDIFVFPTAEGTPNKAAVTVKLKDGTVISSSATMTEGISANNVYDISLTVKGDFKEGTFTIDTIEVVDDEIEF